MTVPSFARAMARLLIVAVIMPGAAEAVARPPGRIVIAEGWIRAFGGGLPAAGYFTLSNDTDQPVRLTGASAAACGSLTLHQTMRHDMPGMAPGMGSMSSMQPLASVPVPPHGSVRFAPGGNHLMCEHPGDAVTPGRSLPVTLHFAGREALTAAFTVRRPRD